MLLNLKLNRRCIVDRSNLGMTSYFLCEWTGQTGSTDNVSLLNEDGSLNSDYLAVRQISVWRSIFPVNDEHFKRIEPILRTRYTFTLGEGNVRTEPVRTSYAESELATIWLQILRIPLSKLKTDIKQYYLYDRNRNKISRNYVQVVGLSNKSGQWCEYREPTEEEKQSNPSVAQYENTPENMAQNMLERNLLNQSFFL